MHIASKQCPAEVLRRIIELLNIGNNDNNGLASIVYHFFSCEDPFSRLL